MFVSTFGIPCATRLCGFYKRLQVPSSAPLQKPLKTLGFLDITRDSGVFSFTDFYSFLPIFTVKYSSNIRQKFLAW
jgi:hypothetical protein